MQYRSTTCSEKSPEYRCPQVLVQMALVADVRGKRHCGDDVLG